MRKRSTVLSALSVLIVLFSLISFFPAMISGNLSNAVLITFGWVTLDGHYLTPQDDATVIASISGVSVEWSRPVQILNNTSYYQGILIPKDTGNGPRDGGENGDIIHFRVVINGITYLDDKTEVFIQNTYDLKHSVYVTSAQLSDLRITTDTLAVGQVGAIYYQSLDAAGGDPPYTWSWSSGAGLPPGLGLDTNAGTITGLPTVSGNYDVTLTVKDSMQVDASKPFTLMIISAADHLMITTTELPRWITAPPAVESPPGWIVGQDYSATLDATGGTGAFHWGAIGLPDGLTISSNTSAISGIPTRTGNFSITFTVSDSANPVHANFKVLGLKIYPRGDANGNGAVSLGDIAYLSKAILNINPITAGCDANTDHNIDVADITEIEKILLH